jgi:hypothetical protein
MSDVIEAVEDTAEKIGGALERIDELRHLIPHIGDVNVGHVVHEVIQAFGELRSILADIVDLTDHVKAARDAAKGGAPAGADA